MEQIKPQEELVSKRQVTYFFIAFVIGGFPWWVWIKPIINGGSEYFLLLVQIPAFLYVIVNAWLVLKKFHKYAIQVLQKTLEAEEYRQAAKDLMSEAELKNEKADKNLMEAQLVVKRAKEKHPNED